MKSVEKIKGAKYKALVDYSYNCKKGDILVLVEDDGTKLPYFRNLSNPSNRFCMYTELSNYRHAPTPEVELYNGRTKDQILAEIDALQKELESLPEWWEEYKKGDRVQMEFTLISDILDSSRSYFPHYQHQNPEVKYIEIKLPTERYTALIPTDGTNIKKVK
jgi:hypothetical protein